MVQGRTGDTELGYILRSNCNAVEAISKVDLNELGGTVAGVGTNNLHEDSFQGTTKLHCLLWGQFECVSVDSGKGVVDDGSGSAPMLGDDANGETRKLRRCLTLLYGKSDQMAFSTMSVISVRRNSRNSWNLIADLWGPRRTASSSRSADQGEDCN